MKNYEVRSITKDLADKTSVTLVSNRPAYFVINMFNKITSGYSKKMLEIAPSVVTPIVPAPAVSTNVNNVAPAITTPTVSTEEPKQELPEKNYEVKVLQTDVNFLKSHQLKIVNAPRRLLISTVFVQKLVLHRMNSINKNITEAPLNDDPKQMAVSRYVELLNKRKEAIEVKQSCEKEITELVTKYGITMDMVNAELAKGNIKK